MLSLCESEKTNAGKATQLRDTKPSIKASSTSSEDLPHMLSSALQEYVFQGIGVAYTGFFLNKCEFLCLSGVQWD
jgi:hypothetical protein